ncbi:MAG: glycosyltransferase family 4 protein [Ktedonobacterales bacterium]|nr:glycosyltransferase family 4 protein [Ktedonobacterales bacterium]
MSRGDTSTDVARMSAACPESEAPRVCMHVLGVARTDGRVMREARALAQTGYDVSIVDIEADTSRPHTEDVEGIHLRHMMMPNWFTPTRFKPFFLLKSARVMRQSSRLLRHTRADAYHAHDANALPACHRAARRRRKPLVFDAHEFPFVEPSTTRFRLLTSIARRRLRQIMRRCDAVITVSAPIAVEMRERYGGPLAVLVRNTPPYIPPTSSNLLRERLGLPETSRIALYQGNLQPDRGLDRLIPAARYLAPGHILVLMGGGSAGAELRAMIESEGVSQQVRILPPVPYDELLAWTASAHLGLIIYPPSFSPNVEMCLPNKLFEYLMAGLPVLASPLVAVEELLRAYDVGAVVPTLETAVVGQAISSMLANTEGLARLRRNALEASRHDLCWEVEQRHLLDLYARLPGMRKSE